MALFTTCPKCDHSFAVDAPGVNAPGTVKPIQREPAIKEKLVQIYGSTLGKNMQPTAFERKIIEIILNEPEITIATLAAQLKKSESAITSALSRIYEKLCVSSRVGLIYFLLT